MQYKIGSIFSQIKLTVSEGASPDTIPVLASLRLAHGGHYLSKSFLQEVLCSCDMIWAFKRLLSIDE